MIIDLFVQFNQCMSYLIPEYNNNNYCIHPCVVQYNAVFVNFMSSEYYCFQWGIVKDERASLFKRWLGLKDDSVTNLFFIIDWSSSELIGLK